MDNLKNVFDRVNREKQLYESKSKLGFIITGIAFISFMPLGIAIGPFAFFLIAIPFLGGAIYAGQNLNKIKEMSNNFKDTYVTEEVKKVFPNSTYNSKYGFSENEVVNTGLLFKRDRFYSEDMLSGEHDGVKFRCCDVKQEEVRKSKKSTRTVTVFQGRFYEFDFPKSFVYNLLLLQPMNFRPFSKFNRVKMESINFNSELKVYAENDHEAFYILTPHFIEKLLYMDAKYADKISFSFLDNRLFIAIDSRKDYFDLQPYKKVDMSLFDDYKQELDDIKEFISVLKLNESIFKKN